VMRKQQEIENTSSCFCRAREDEMIFVLLGRDVAAPATIRTWVEERIRLGKNWRSDSQMQEALRCAEVMEKEQRGYCRQ
jgi:hypothetical protein